MLENMIKPIRLSFIDNIRGSTSKISEKEANLRILGRRRRKKALFSEIASPGTGIPSTNK